MPVSNRVSEAVEVCEERIGQVWAEMFPEATTGDFPPDAAEALNRAVGDALVVWLQANTELVDPERPHRIVRVHQ